MDTDRHASDARRLGRLAASLRGRPPRGVDWDSVVLDANRALASPTLYEALRDAPPADPPDAELLDYLALVHRLNAERNRRLRAQLVEAVGALNAAGIEPTLLKGAAFLAATPSERIARRMMSDLDILIAPADLESGEHALERLGYAATARGRGRHAAVVMARGCDAAPVDLHHRPPGPEALHRAARPANRLVFPESGAFALVPDGTERAFQLFVHDMLHDGGLRKGTVELRHLFEIADQIAAGEEIRLDQAAPRLAGLEARAAWAVFLHDLSGLAGVPAAAIPAPAPAVLWAALLRRTLIRRFDTVRRLDTSALGLIAERRRAAYAFRRRLRLKDVARHANASGFDRPPVVKYRHVYPAEEGRSE